MADITPKGSPQGPKSSTSAEGTGKIDLSVSAAKPAEKADSASPAKQSSETKADAAKPPMIVKIDEAKPASAAPAKPSQPASKAPKTTPPPAKLEGADQKAGVLSFTNIFNQEKEKKKETNVISSVLKKKTSPSAAKPILGAAPTLQKSLDEQKKVQLKRKLRLVQTVFTIVFLASAASAFYFYSELSPTFDIFGTNTTQNLAIANENLRSVQTQISAYRYKAAQLSLNRFSFISDQFLDATVQVSNGGLTTTQLQSLNASTTQATQELPQLLSDIREQLSASIVVPTVRSEVEEELTAEQIEKNAEDALRNTLLEERREITNSGELTLDDEQDLELLDNTIKLVGNKKLLSAVKGTSVEQFKADLEAYAAEPDPVKREELRGFMSTILASTKSDVATIGALKSTRIEWSTIINRIEEVTGKVDPTFGSGLTESLGDGIFYTGYDFDTSTNKIVLSGVTRTTIADNFTLITRLIDFLEESSYFENVEMRSFSKAGDFAQGFTSSFKIDLALETNGYSDKNAPISLEKRTVANAARVKRSQ